MYEHHRQPLLPFRDFLRRLALHGGLALAIIVGSWIIGILGYHLLEGQSWIDAVLNAAMILGGMGPVTALHTSAGKLFASFYALYSGMVFLVAAGVLMTPVFHRVQHRFHLDEMDQAGSPVPRPPQN
jgi:hypothetical protein